MVSVEAAVLDHDGPPGVPAQEGEHVQQGPDLAHPVHAVLDVVLVEGLLGIVYVRGAVDILDAPLLPGLRPLAGEEDHRGLVAAHHRLAGGPPRSGTMV